MFRRLIFSLAERIPLALIASQQIRKGKVIDYIIVPIDDENKVEERVTAMEVCDDDDDDKEREDKLFSFEMYCGLSSTFAQ